jgi:predicted dehydrogenase
MSDKKPKIGVVGAGHLGKHHIKHLSNHKGVDFVGVFDINEDSLKNICDEFSVKPLQSLEELISLCEAVNIVTPTNTHFDIARKFLNQKKDVFIEKPLTNTVEEALSLINLAKTNECIVQVGHIERFNPTINKLKELVDNPHYIEIERLAPFQARGTEVPVVLDLMVHDIDLILEMVNSPLESIQASGAKMMSNSIDLAHAHIKFQNGVVANLKSSRIAQNYVRKIRTYQKNFYSITDLMIPQIELYGLKHHNAFSKELKSQEVETNTGLKTLYYEKFVPENKDALLEEINDFIHCINTRSKPNVDGQAGANALEIALKIENEIFLNE